MKWLFVGCLVFLGLGTLFFYNSPAETLTITGLAVESGSVNVSVGSYVSVNFTTDSIAWGSGELDLGETSATLNTRTGTVTGGTWSPVSSGFVVQSLGNLNASVWLKSGKNETDFIGGTSPAYQYSISNVEDNACIPPSGFSLDTFYDVNTSGDGTMICETFVSGDSFEIDLKLVIPSNSDTGSLSDTLTITVGE